MRFAFIIYLYILLFDSFGKDADEKRNIIISKMLQIIIANGKQPTVNIIDRWHDKSYYATIAFHGLMMQLRIKYLYATLLFVETKTPKIS